MLTLRIQAAVTALDMFVFELGYHAGSTCYFTALQATSLYLFVILDVLTSWAAVTVDKCCVDSYSVVALWNRQVFSNIMLINLYI